MLTIGIISLILVSIFACNKIPKQPDIALDQIEVLNLERNKIDISSYNDKPLVINFWATWCAPCIQEFPYFEEVINELGKEVNFVMISDESIEKITQFSSDTHYSFNYLKSEKTLSDYNISLLPITYFFDSNGNLITKHTSNIDTPTLKKLVESLK